MLCLNQLLQWMVSCRHFEYTIRAERMISFLFDIFLGPSYNQSPPSVKYMTVTYSCVFLAPRLLIARRQMVENSDSIPIFTQSVGYHHVILSRSSYSITRRMARFVFPCLGLGRVLVGFRASRLYCRYFWNFTAATRSVLKPL